MGRGAGQAGVRMGGIGCAKCQAARDWRAAEEEFPANERESHGTLDSPQGKTDAVPIYQWSKPIAGKPRLGVVKHTTDRQLQNQICRGAASASLDSILCIQQHFFQHTPWLPSCSWSRAPKRRLPPSPPHPLLTKCSRAEATSAARPFSAGATGLAATAPEAERGAELNGLPLH